MSNEDNHLQPMNAQFNPTSMSGQAHAVPPYTGPTNMNANMNANPSPTPGYTEYSEPQYGMTWYNMNPYNNPPVNQGYAPYNTAPQMAGYYPPQHHPGFQQPDYMHGQQYPYIGSIDRAGQSDSSNIGAIDPRSQNLQRPGSKHGARSKQYPNYGGQQRYSDQPQYRRQPGSHQNSQSGRQHNNNRTYGYDYGRNSDTRRKTATTPNEPSNESESADSKGDRKQTHISSKPDGRGSNRQSYQYRKNPVNKDFDKATRQKQSSTTDDKQYESRSSVSNDQVNPGSKHDILDSISSLLEKKNESKSALSDKRSSRGASGRQYENGSARGVREQPGNGSARDVREQPGTGSARGVREHPGRRLDSRNYTKPTDTERNIKSKSTKETTTSRSVKPFQSDIGLQGRRRKFTPNRKGQTTESQTGSMIESLSSGTYECMVCCDVIRCQAAVWSCQACYTVFHLHCVRKWARSPLATSTVESADGWRCPACQNVCHKIPSLYKCFCGKIKEPEWDRMTTPHSCAEICGKRRPETSCPHTCNILCHPGPCPTCPVTTTKTCACGRTKKSIRCGTATEIHCDQVCGWKLNCGTHTCERICHPGECGHCQVEVNQGCFCGKSNRDILCGDTPYSDTNEDTLDSDSSEDSGFYACEQICGRELSCGNHTCQQLCHKGDCQPCQFLPSIATHCPCGQTLISALVTDGTTRTSCTDPLPTCELTCNKLLACGSQDDHHICKSKCHTGDCGPCEGVSEVKCRCGYMDKEIACSEITTNTAFQLPTCDKRCNKKRQCGRHKCTQRCCVDDEHKCPLVCNRKLNCGWHKCEEPCHSGNCEQCWQTGFDELTCYCGAEILFPPIPCGTRPPDCSRVCTRQHDCDHTVHHSCHSEEKCPPCTFLVERQCMGGHETRRNIPCHIKDISCGKMCGKMLPCQQHRCQKICHKDECDEICNQPCTVVRSECGHPCGSPCHPGQPCPKLPCKRKISVTCKCGNRKEEGICQQGGDSLQMAQSYQRLATSQLASKMSDIQSGQSVDIRYLTQMKDGSNPRQLDCTEECAVIERNRRFADALQIQNPEISSKPSVTYCQFLKDQAKKNPEFVSSVERELVNLVTSVQQSKHKKRSHSFAPMNRDNRRVVHELAELYGCETQSYDQEPKRNTVATAVKNKSEIPAVTLTSYTQRQLHPKAPPPIPHGGNIKEFRQTVLASNKSTNLKENNSKTETTVDYFDMVQ